MKTIDDVAVEGRRVLVRADLNVPLDGDRIADDGRITNFKVMVRPLKALNLLHRLMGEQLASAASGPGNVATAA